MAIIPSRFLDAVVSIGVRQGTNTKWIGTGFFVLRKMVLCQGQRTKIGSAAFQNIMNVEE